MHKSTEHTSAREAKRLDVAEAKCRGEHLCLS